MSTAQLPPEVSAELAKLRGDVADLQRRSERNVPAIGALADVDGTPTATGDVLAYDKATGRWAPGSADAYIGQVSWSASPLLPPGRWLEADGTAVSRSTYAELFAEIGIVYGAGNGSTTFNVPNISGRVVVGVGTDGLAATGGSRDAAVISHTHPTGHSPTSGEVSGYGLPPNDQDVAFENRVRVNSPGGAGTGDVTGGTGGSGTGANMQPFIALWAYIRY